MNPLPQAVEVPSSIPENKGDEPPPHLLPSGRSVVVRIAGNREELEVRSPQGDVEVRITLTESGPVVCLRGARLELESPDVVALNCRRLEVHTTEGAHLDSSAEVRITGREVQVQTQDDIDLKGKVIHLN